MQRLFLLAKVAVSAGLLWYIFQGIDLAGVTQDILSIDSGWLGLGFLAMAGHVMACFVRWREIIAGLGHSMPLHGIVKAYYIAMFVNSFMPGTVGGDLLRMWYAAKYGIPGQAAVHSVLFERVATILGLLILISLATPFLSAFIVEPAIIYGFNGATLVAIAGIAAIGLLYPVAARWRHWRIVDVAVEFGSDTRRLFLVPWTSIRITSVTMLSHVFSALVIYSLTRGAGFDVPFWGMLALSMPVLLLAGLPISIAGWGVREGAMVAALALLSVPKESALAVSILFGMLGVLIALPGFIFWLRSPAPENNDSSRGGAMLADEEQMRR